MKRKFKVDVKLINDCKAAVLAEKQFGDGKNYENIVYLTFSSGIGCGAIINGKLIEGKDGNACEIGHTVIDINSKLKCGCGAYGHWEAYCAGKNIPNFVKYLAKNFDYKNSLLYEKSNKFKNLDSKLVFECAKENDKFSKFVINEIGKINSIGISNVINIFDPEFISIGGSIAINNKKEILNPIKKYIKKYCINRIPKIKITKLNDIVLLGALAYAKII